MRLIFVTLSFLIIPSNALIARPLFKSESMVTSAHNDATNAGVAILKMGGNAVDAAIAAALAISVVEPFAAGLGGGGFMMLHLAKKKEVKVLDFREVAPLKAREDMYSTSASSTEGHLAVAVPGTMAGLYEAHRKHGKLPWKKLFPPAIRLARYGFEVDSKFVDAFNSAKKRLQLNPQAWKTFTREQEPYEIGQILKQPELASTLERLSKNPRDFYEGIIAEAISRDMKESRGLVSGTDLREYKPKWRNPLCGNFMNLEICSMPPPSSGGIVLLQMLNAVSEIGANNLPWHEPKTINQLAHVMKTAFEDRATYLGDPDFVKIPVDKLLSREYIRTKIGLKPVALPKESNDTSHINVVDKDRNAVSLTFTINLSFGSGVMVPGTGILLNNEMDDFATQPDKPNAFGLIQGKANSVAPSKIPLSSMTPVIARRNGEFSFALGAPGGSRIITQVFHTILNHLVYQMSIDRAISSGRFHHQWKPNEISYEKFTFDPKTIEALTGLGHVLKEENPPMNTGMILAPQSGGLLGAVDPRGHGVVSGI